MCTKTMIALLALLANLAVTVVSAQGLDNIHHFNKRLSSGCALDSPASCSVDPPPSNLCCYESPGGLLLQTQFWDTNPSTGPSNSWTIHGLWPDNCDGTFSESCDPSRDYTNITGLLVSQGASSTLSFMNEYWISNDETNEALWEHEWAARGTCYSTLNPSCLPSGSTTGAEAVAFFEQVVALFQTLPTYNWLESQGITPDSSRTYTLSQFTNALSTASDFTPVLGCSGSTISSISWYFNLQGSLLDGKFIPINAPVSESSTCPSSGLLYPPKF
ncbi:Ribonuclease T2-like protein [Lactarius tabidus]